MNETIKYQILAALENGQSAKDLVTEFSVPYPQILKLKKEFREARISGDIGSVIAADKLLVARVADEVAKEGVLDPDKIEELTAGIDGYSALAVGLQDLAIVLIANIRAQSALCTDMDKIEQMVRCVTSLQNSFFNKGITNLSVFQQQNNIMSDNQVSTFKSLKRA